MSSKTGDVLYCGECGLEVTVSKACGCGDDCVVTCCEKPMKKKEADRPKGCCCR